LLLVLLSLDRGPYPGAPPDPGPVVAAAGIHTVTR
jgi:hypothetical protein